MTTRANKIIEASRGVRGPGRKSDAYRFLENEKNYREIIASPVSWGLLASKLNETGMRDVNGHLLTGHSVYATWQRVKAAKKTGVGKRMLTGGPSLTSHVDPPASFDFKVIAKDKK